jgi:hypothetical protein
VPSPWTLKEGSNGGAPPDIFGLRNRPQLQDIRLKGRINSRPPPLGQENGSIRAKARPAGLIRRHQVCLSEVSAGPKCHPILRASAR